VTWDIHSLPAHHSWHTFEYAVPLK